MRSRKDSGFTLVELLLAMAFLGFLLLFMVTATIQIMRSYNKGIVMKQINQTARTTLEDMTRQIRTIDGTQLNTSFTTTERLCLGGISYVWNRQGSVANKKDDVAQTPVGLVRVQDPSGSMCAGGRPLVPANQSTDLLTGRVWVQDIVAQQNTDRQLVQLTLGLSTTQADAPSGTPLACPTGAAGQFCAFVSFTTTVNTRGGKQ